MTFGGLTKGKNITLPFKASYPYDYNNCSSKFWLSYISQCLSVYCGSLVTIGFETFIMVLIIQICSQLDIIYHRLQTLPYLNKNNMSNETKEAKIIKECVLHHNYIYTYDFH